MATTLTRKPLDFFKQDPGNPRMAQSAEVLWPLHDSLRERQHVPLLAKLDGTILDGFRRWSAAMLDGRPAELDVILTDEPLTPVQVKEIQLVTALHRTDLSPYEQFVGCRDWLAMNPDATAKELAARIHRDKSMLVRILSLSRCIPAVQQAAQEGRLGPSQWYAISKVPEAEQEKLLSASLTGASRDQIEKQGRKLRTVESNGIHVSRLAIPLGSNRSVTIAGSQLSLEDAIDLLQETLKLARKAQSEKLDGKTWVQVMKQKAKAGA